MVLAISYFTPLIMHNAQLLHHMTPRLTNASEDTKTVHYNVWLFLMNILTCTQLIPYILVKSENPLLDSTPLLVAVKRIWLEVIHTETRMT